LVLTAVVCVVVYYKETAQTRTQAKAAKAASEKRDIDRILSSDHSSWQYLLLGKPVTYLGKIGLNPYHKMPRFGKMSQTVLEKQGNLWLIEHDGKNIIRISPMLIEAPTPRQSVMTDTVRNTPRRFFLFHR
jgi:hypothetical protein